MKKKVTLTEARVACDAAAAAHQDAKDRCLAAEAEAATVYADHATSLARRMDRIGKLIAVSRCASDSFRRAVQREIKDEVSRAKRATGKVRAAQRMAERFGEAAWRAADQHERAAADFYDAAGDGSSMARVEVRRLPRRVF